MTIAGCRGGQHALAGRAPCCTAAIDDELMTSGRAGLARRRAG
jgi:hypothetical protein